MSSLRARSVVAAALAAALLAPAMSVNVAAASTTWSPHEGAVATGARMDLVARLSGRQGPRPTVSAPRSVQVGTTFTIKGKFPVRARQRRAVKIALGGAPVAKTRTSRSGKFALRLVAGAVPAVATYVVSSPKTTKVKASKRAVRVTFTAAPITAITSDWPAGTISVPLGQQIPVSGVVTGTRPAGRTVVVQQQFGGTWVDRGTTTTAADGTYSAILYGSWLFSAPARVLVRASVDAPEAVGVEVSTSVTPTWTPGGSPSSWVPVYDGYRVRVNPCEPVEYRANLAQAPAYAREALTDAIASVSAATGVTFVNLGDSTGIGKPEPGYTGIPTDTDLLVAWVYDAQTVASQPVTNGGVTIHDTLARGTDAYGPVTVAKKTAVNMNAAYHGGWNRTLMTHVYRHEIGHVLGLGHPVAQDQVMGAGEAASTNFAWGAGDLAGFARLGLQAGCVSG